MKMANGLTDLVLRTGKPWRLDPARIAELIQEGSVVLRGEPPLDWLGVPLSMDGRILGMLAVQSYQGGVHYSQGDLELLQFVSGQIAASLQRQGAEEERKRLEAELQHAQKLESLGSLAGGVAHDMNNVLGAIHAVTQTLKLNHAGDPKLIGPLSTIERAALRGRDLVKGLSDFARKDLREAAPVDLNEVVAQECELLSRTLFQRVRLDKDLQEGLPLVMGEPGALGSAFMNLCVNAVDAMPDGGVLVIRTRSLPGARVELAVEDSGEGMAPEVLSRAMEPFYTTKPYGKGTGLGLSMVYSTVKAHGGTVALESAPGQGTRVRLNLPALPEVPRPAVQDLPLQDPGRPLRILLVDDDELIRDAAPELLALLGHQVSIAASGAEGLERVEADPELDVVILDVNMPDMSGVETLAHLRSLRPGLPVILATGFLGDAVKEILDSDPRVLALSKPYTLEEARVKLVEAAGR
jgi:signal transduction histidine kinase